MVRAVYRLDETGNHIYLGHVPDGYELRDGEHFYPKPDDTEISEDKEIRSLNNDNSQNE